MMPKKKRARPAAKRAAVRRKANHRRRTTSQARDKTNPLFVFSFSQTARPHPFLRTAVAKTNGVIMIPTVFSAIVDHAVGRHLRMCRARGALSSPTPLQTRSSWGPHASIHDMGDPDPNRLLPPPPLGTLSHRLPPPRLREAAACLPAYERTEILQQMREREKNAAPASYRRPRHIYHDTTNHPVRTHTCLCIYAYLRATPLPAGTRESFHQKEATLRATASGLNACFSVSQKHTHKTHDSWKAGAAGATAQSVPTLFIHKLAARRFTRNRSHERERVG